MHIISLELIKIQLSTWHQACTFDNESPGLNQ